MLQDYEGPPANAREGREYFKRRFARLAQKAGRSKEREIYIQYVPLVSRFGSLSITIVFKYYYGDGHGSVESGHGSC